MDAFLEFKVAEELRKILITGQATIPKEDIESIGENGVRFRINSPATLALNLIEQSKSEDEETREEALALIETLLKLKAEDN